MCVKEEAIYSLLVKLPDLPCFPSSFQSCPLDSSIIGELLDKNPSHLCFPIDDVAYGLSEQMRACDMTNLSLLSYLGAQELTTLPLDFEKPLVLTVVTSEDDG
ncbi:hypothetical protein Tco_0816375 [Tanacetum coccineum]